MQKIVIITKRKRKRKKRKEKERKRKRKKIKEKEIGVAFFTVDRETTFLLFDSIIKATKPICEVVCTPKLIGSASECVPRCTLHMNIYIRVYKFNFNHVRQA